MATSVSLSFPFLLVLMACVGHGSARTLLNPGERRYNMLPYLRDSGVYDNQHGARQLYRPQSTVTGDEPSSRGLDIDFTVGEGDDVDHYPETPSERIRSGYVVREGYRDDHSPEDVNIGVFEDPPPSRYASSGWTEGAPDEEANQWRRNQARAHQGVVAQPLDYKVGEVKLRNDRGYQLSMHVPPSSAGERPGVLKIDMKATLYKPIYY